MAHNEETKNGVEFHVISLQDQIGECYISLPTITYPPLTRNLSKGTAIRSALTETEQDTQAKFDDNVLVEVKARSISRI